MIDQPGMISQLYVAELARMSEAELLEHRAKVVQVFAAGRHESDVAVAG